MRSCYLPALTIMAPPLAKAHLDASYRADLNSDFIRNNPALRDTLIALADRVEAERRQTGLAMVRDDGDPVMGNPNGKITLYEFLIIIAVIADVFATIQQLLRNNRDVRLVINFQF